MNYSCELIVKEVRYNRGQRYVKVVDENRTKLLAFNDAVTLLIERRDVDIDRRH